MEEQFDGTEKRKFKRMVFSAKDNVTALVTWPEQGDARFTYRISDIGAGGMRFIVTKENAPSVIDYNDVLFVHQIKGQSQLEFVAGVQLEVRWVIEHDMFEHMVIGCEFVGIADDVRGQVDRFVESELARETQEK